MNTGFTRDFIRDLVSDEHKPTWKALSRDEMGVFYPRRPIEKKGVSGLRFCPACLDEDETPYLRRTWELAYVGACVKHQCLLEDRCLSCGHQVMPYKAKWQENFTTCPSCKKSITRGKVVKIDDGDYSLRVLREVLNSDRRLEWINKLSPILQFVAKRAEIGDPVFDNNPFVDLKRFHREWEKKNSPFRTSIISEPSVAFVILGVANKLLENDEMYCQLLARYYTNKALYRGEKPYICPKCNYRADFIEGIKRHLSTHGSIYCKYVRGKISHQKRGSKERRKLPTRTLLDFIHFEG